MEKYIERWLQKGLIDSATSQKLIEDMESERVRILKLRFNILIYVLAAICIGIGVSIFVAKNDWILKLFSQKPIIRIISLFCLSAISLVSGYMFAYKKGNFPRLGQSLIFLSSILFGTSYALIWITYNIKKCDDLMMFLWLFTILPIAYKFRNRFVNRLSILVFLCGCCCEFFKYKMSLYLIFPMLVGSFLYTIGGTSKRYEEFFTDYKATGFALIFFALLGLNIFGGKIHSVNTFVYVSLISLICCNLYLYSKQSNIFEKKERLLLSCILMIVVGISVCPKLPAIISICIANALIIAILWTGFQKGYEKKDQTLVGIMNTCTMIYFIPNLLITAEMFTFPKLPAIISICIANALIIAILWAGFRKGYEKKDQTLIGIMNTCTMVYLISNYYQWGWSRLKGAAFFSVGGVILLAIGIFLERSRKKAK
jgi:uncharacterized membrane protein